MPAHSNKPSSPHAMQGCWPECQRCTRPREASIHPAAPQLVARNGTHPSPAACHMSTRQNTTALRTSGLGWWKAANRPGSSWLGPTASSSLGVILGATSCNTATAADGPALTGAVCLHACLNKHPRTRLRCPGRHAEHITQQSGCRQGVCLVCGVWCPCSPAGTGWWRTAPPRPLLCRCWLRLQTAACVPGCRRSAAGAWTA